MQVCPDFIFWELLAGLVASHGGLCSMGACVLLVPMVYDQLPHGEDPGIGPRWWYHAQHVAVFPFQKYYKVATAWLQVPTLTHLQNAWAVA